MGGDGGAVDVAGKVYEGTTRRRKRGGRGEKKRIPKDLGGRVFGTK